MRRGEVWWIDFDPSIGGEIQKLRPAVIISNNSTNRMLNRVQVVPISSQTSRLFVADALITVNGQSRKALGDQLTTVSKLRVGNQIGVLSATDLAEVERVIKLQLGLP